MLKSDLKPVHGDLLRYDCTLRPCTITSCSCSPQCRASWQNTLVFGDTAVCLSAYYTKGYDTASIDFEGKRGDCAYNAANGTSTHTYVDETPVNCKTKDIWNLDLTVSQKIGEDRKSTRLNSSH